MDYTDVPATDVSAWDDDYKELKDDIALENDGNAKRRKTIELQKLAVKIEKRMGTDMDMVQRNQGLHLRETARIMAASQQEIKRARSLAASYRKKPQNAQFVAQLQVSIRALADLENDLKADNQAYGAAWIDYRGEPVKTVPEKIRTAFGARRQVLINADKPVFLKLHQLQAFRHEADALTHLTDKAAMKADLKRNVPQRPIADAQRAAHDLATQMDNMLKILRTPAGQTPKPAQITSAKNTLVPRSTNPASLQVPNALGTSRSMWVNGESAYKLMVAQAASMEKVLTIKIRALRTNELSDPTVKAELVTARQHLAAAKLDIKNKTADYNAAKKAMAKKLKIT